MTKKSCEYFWCFEEFYSSDLRRSYCGSRCRQKAGVLKITLKRYGMTPRDLYNVVMAQCWSCPICVTNIDGSNYAFDHNHETGDFRGVTCRRCNTLLGFSADSPEILERAVNYLRQRREGPQDAARLDIEEDPTHLSMDVLDASGGLREPGKADW